MFGIEGDFLLVASSGVPGAASRGSVAGGVGFAGCLCGEYVASGGSAFGAGLAVAPPILVLLPWIPPPRAVLEVVTLLLLFV